MSSSLFSPDPIREDFLLTWLIGHQLRSHYPKDHVFSATLLPPQGPAHGIVIGIDYDLGYQRDEDILADWQGYLPDKELRLLAHVLSASSSLRCRRKQGISLQLIPFLFSASRNAPTTPSTTVFTEIPQRAGAVVS